MRQHLSFFNSVVTEILQESIEVSLTSDKKFFIHLMLFISLCNVIHVYFEELILQIDLKEATYLLIKGLYFSIKLNHQNFEVKT